LKIKGKDARRGYIRHKSKLDYGKEGWKKWEQHWKEGPGEKLLDSLSMDCTWDTKDFPSSVHEISYPTTKRR